MQNIFKVSASFDSERRGFIRRAGWMSLGALAALNLAHGNPAVAAAMKSKMSKSDQDDVAILNSALSLEYQAIAAYQVGAESNLLQKPVLDVAVKFQSHHRAHAGVLADTVRKMGGQAAEARAAADYGFPVDKLKSQADVLRFAAGLEQGAASAYLGAVPTFHNRSLAKAAASILGDETMHWAVLLSALGDDPVPVAFIG